MLMQYVLLLLGLIVGVGSHEICNFEKHLCNWSNLHPCHFVHEKNKPLAGEKGYLYISKNTCKRAGIYFNIQRYYHRFQLHYFINGTGSGILAVSANYRWSGRHFVWTCNLNQGNQWQKADIFVSQEGMFDSLRHIYIEAFIRSGDITIAIGNILSYYTGHPVARCPAAPRITKKPTVLTTTTKKPTPEPTTILKTTSSIITSSAKSKVYHSTEQTASQTNAPNTLKTQVTTAEPVTSKSPVTTPEEVAVSSQKRTQPIKSTLGTSSISVTGGLTSDQNKGKDTTASPAVTPTSRPAVTPTAKPAVTATASNPPKPMTEATSQQTPPVYDVTTLKAVSNGTYDKQQQQSPKSKKKGLIIGVSLFAVILATAVIVFSVLVHRRKIRMWNVQKHTQFTGGIDNPVYE